LLSIRSGIESNVVFFAAQRSEAKDNYAINESVCLSVTLVHWGQPPYARDTLVNHAYTVQDIYEEFKVVSGV